MSNIRVIIQQDKHFVRPVNGLAEEKRPSKPSIIFLVFILKKRNIGSACPENSLATKGLCKNLT